jgi:hypothetical protein
MISDSMDTSSFSEVAMTSKEKQKMWSERVAAWEVSGESMRAYALRHGWRTRQLVWWRQRLTALPVDAPAMLPVTVVQSRVSALRLAGANWSLDLPAATPASWLAELLRSL